MKPTSKRGNEGTAFTVSVLMYGAYQSERYNCRKSKQVGGGADNRGRIVETTV